VASVATLQRENAELRAQLAQLLATNAEQMARVLLPSGPDDGHRSKLIDGDQRRGQSVR
jgi:hypothetical protein